MDNRKISYKLTTGYGLSDDLLSELAAVVVRMDDVFDMGEGEFTVEEWYNRAINTIGLHHANEGAKFLFSIGVDKKESTATETKEGLSGEEKDEMISMLLDEIKNTPNCEEPTVCCSEEDVSYFQEVDMSDKVFSIIFGNGVVTNLYYNGYYSFEVTFGDGITMPYTEDGVPSWYIKNGDQTLWYKDEIDVTDFDVSPASELLTSEDIKRSRHLDIRCPSGIWHDVADVPDYIIKNAINGTDGIKTHLFRKKTNA